MIIDVTKIIINKINDTFLYRRHGRKRNQDQKTKKAEAEVNKKAAKLFKNWKGKIDFPRLKKWEHVL